MIYPWGQGGGVGEVWCELSMYSTHAPRKGRGVSEAEQQQQQQQQSYKPGEHHRDVKPGTVPFFSGAGD